MSVCKRVVDGMLALSDMDKDIFRGLEWPLDISVEDIVELFRVILCCW